MHPFTTGRPQPQNIKSNTPAPATDVNSAEQRTTEDMLARYDLGQRLINGPTGKVYCATDLITNEDVVVKVLPQKPNSTAERWEAKAMAILNGHPLIVREREFFTTENSTVIVMDKLQGGDLLQSVLTVKDATDHGFDEAIAKRLMAEIVLSLHYCHTQEGILHCDIKPENVFLSSTIDMRNHSVKGSADIHTALGDFGSSCPFSHVEENWSGIVSIGTTHYASPEKLRRTPLSRKQLPLTDVWSLGALLFVMLTGCFPFYSRDKATLIHKVCYNEPRYPSYMSDSAKDLIVRMMDKNIDTRISLEEVMQHPWLQQTVADVRITLPVGYQCVATEEKDAVVAEAEQDHAETEQEGGQDGESEIKRSSLLIKAQRDSGIFLRDTVVIHSPQRLPQTPEVLAA